MWGLNGNVIVQVLLLSQFVADVLYSRFLAIVRQAKVAVGWIERD
jgi:hypothetical protein